MPQLMPPYRWCVANSNRSAPSWLSRARNLRSEVFVVVSLDDDERDPGITEMVSLELVSSLTLRQVGLVDDVCHALPPAAHPVSRSVTARSPVVVSHDGC